MARIGQYDLELDLGINALNGSKKLTEVFTGSTAIADARNKLPHLFGWAKHKGWTDAEIMSLYYGEAGWHHCFWAGQNGDYASATPSPAVNITVGAGFYLVTSTLPHACGIYRGAGSRFADMSGTHSYGSTEWEFDHLNWKTKYFPERIIMRSANWSGTGDGAWVHNVVIEHMHFNGARRTKWYSEDGTLGAGLAIQDMGEAAYINHCYFDDFEKDGLILMGGTPATATCCSFFNTNRLGCAVLGGGSVLLIRPSGDENGLALVGNDGKFYGRDPRCALTIIGFKHETSTSDPFRPWKGSALVDYTGWLTLDIRGGTYAAGHTQPYCMIRVNPTVNKSSITVSGVQFFANAPKVMLYDAGKNLEYNFVGNCWHNAIAAWSWHQDHGIKTDWVTIPVSAGKGDRLQHVGPDGAVDWPSAKLYDVTGGSGPVVPPTATWILGTPGNWSTCVNGTRTRTTPYVSSIPGQTPTAPKPADRVETEPCTVTPPATGTMALFNFSTGTAANITGNPGTLKRERGTSTMNGGKLTNTNPSTSYSCSWKGATVFTFTGLNWNGDMSYRLLCGLTDTDGQGRGIMVRPDGSVIDNRVSQGDKVIAPAGTVKPGTAVSFSVTVAPMDVSFFGAGPNAGNSWLGTLDELVVK